MALWRQKDIISLYIVKEPNLIAFDHILMVSIRFSAMCFAKKKGLSTDIFFECSFL